MKIEIRGPLDCHIWCGALTTEGYPVMNDQGKTRLARRVFYERAKGPIPPNRKIVMACGERACVWEKHMVARPR